MGFGPHDACTDEVPEDVLKAVKEKGLMGGVPSYGLLLYPLGSAPPE